MKRGNIYLLNTQEVNEKTLYDLKTVEAHYKIRNFGGTGFIRNRFGMCGVQPAAWQSRSIGVMQQAASAVRIIFKLFVPLGSTLHAAQSRAEQLRV
jgi:hypothetical protein